MRLNKFLAENTQLSRRSADTAIENGRVKINGAVASLGQTVEPNDTVSLDGLTVESEENKKTITVLLNKPVGYVCSKNGQGSKTVYDLLPETYKQLNIAGRLDKDSSGLVVLTNDGTLLNELTHPSSKKEKVYRITTNHNLSDDELSQLIKGVNIRDERPSKFKSIHEIGKNKYEVTIEEGRNRQIRRALEAVNKKVLILHRISIGTYNLDNIEIGKYKTSS